jgi:hypothetical protein
MFSTIGFLELVIVALISVVSLAIPTATFVMAVLIYRKLTHIEQMLNRRE